MSKETRKRGVKSPISQQLQPGATPQGALIAEKGMLYGTTYAGGAQGYGTVFVLKQKR